ncbi:aldolase/citrate lyase family protein [Chloroflexota bacterium]
MVQFGPADYSISTGHAWQPDRVELQKAHETMIEMALKKGVAPRVEVATVEDAKPFWEMGVRHFCIGWDVFTMSTWCREQGEAWKGLVAGQ